MQYKNFGTYLKNKRLKTGITLNAFSLDIDVDSAIISRVENLKQDVKLQTLIKIANGFNMSLSELLKEFEQF